VTVSWHVIGIDEVLEKVTFGEGGAVTNLDGVLKIKWLDAPFA